MTIHTALSNSLLDHVFGGGDYTRLATVYIGLSSTIPIADGTGFTEPSAGAYARVAVTNNATNFPAAASRSKSNGIAITFPTATADWLSAVNLIAAGVFSASTGGVPIISGAITPIRAVLSGQTPKFIINALTFELK